jgi:hypothetical protein
MSAQPLGLAAAIAAITTAAPATAQRAAPITLVESHTIGCTACTGPELFSGIQDLAVLDNGSVLIADRTAPFLRLFAPSGAVEFAVLAQGEGPGDARIVNTVAPLRDARIAVLDNRLTRMTILDREGRFLETRGFEAFPIGLYGMVDGTGLWVVETNFRAEPTFSVWPSDSLAPVPTAIELDSLGFPAEDLPFQIFAAAAGPGGRFAIGEGQHAYRIRVVSGDGRTMYDVVRDIERTPKSATQIEEERAERARARRRLASGAGGLENPEAAALGSDIEIDPLERYFRVYDLEFDTEGRLWVRTPRDTTSHTVFDVFDESGRYVGEVRVDGRISHYAVGHGILAAVTLDSLDVETVKVWKYR